MANKKDDIDVIVWTRERILADTRLVFIVTCIGILMFLLVRTYLAPH